MQIIFNKKVIQLFSNLITLYQWLFLLCVYGFGKLVHFDEYVERFIPLFACLRERLIRTIKWTTHYFVWLQLLFFMHQERLATALKSVYGLVFLNFLALLLPTIYFLNHVLHSPNVNQLNKDLH